MQYPYYNPYPNYGYQPTVQPSLMGRIVNNINEVMPNEVPANGTMAVFPDLGANVVYVKRMQQDGTIQTLKYVAEQPSESTKTTDVTTIINERFDRLEKLMAGENGNEQSD